MIYTIERQWEEEGDYFYECDECDFAGDIAVVAIGDRFSATASFDCPECGWEVIQIEVRGSMEDM